jgi:hypothetical protein
LLKFKERFTLTHLFKISKTLWVLLLKSVKWVCATQMLVSSENSIGTDLSFIFLGTSFTYMRKSKDPKPEHWGKTCFTLAQLETLFLASILLYNAVLRYIYFPDMIY